MLVHKTRYYTKLLNKIIVKENGMVGSILYSNTCGKFTVLERVKKENNHYLFKIKFINTGEIYISRGDLLLNGEIKDYMAKTIYGIACLGREYLNIREKDPLLCKKLFKRYKSMIERCYCKNDSSYKFYGAIGIKVDSRWFNFCNYYNDIINLDNFDREKFLSKELIIDKDIKQIHIEHNKRIYSRDTVTLVNEKENLNYRDLSNCGKETAKNTSKYFAMIENNYISYHKNICEFARETGINESSIRDSIHGRTNIVKNKYMFRWLIHDEKEKIENGILKLNKKYKVNL